MARLAVVALVVFHLASCVSAMRPADFVSAALGDFSAWFGASSANSAGSRGNPSGRTREGLAPGRRKSGCRVSTAAFANREEVVTSPRPHEVMDVRADLPVRFFWGDVDGVNYLTETKNQHIPTYCGSCWAHATSSALSDRIALARNGRFPEIDLSPQVLVDCVTGNGTRGCNGGDPTAAYAWIAENGLTDETCQNYLAKDGACDAFHVCQTCDPPFGESRGCYAVTPPTNRVYGIEAHGVVRGEEGMLREIFANGPIACGVCVTDAFEAYEGGIFSDATGCVDQDHEISIAGFGTTSDGVKYWIGRNSWGSYWGEAGWFRIVRGENALGVEDACDWAVPETPKEPQGLPP